MEANATAAATTLVNAVAAVPVSATGGTEFVIQAVTVGLTVLFALITFGVLYWIRHSSAAAKWNLNNEKTEATLKHAIDFAEGLAKSTASGVVNKKGASVDYFNKVAPELVKQYGSALDSMIERKAAELNTSGYTEVVKPAEEPAKAEEVPVTK